jgi:hypothetical protein
MKRLKKAMKEGQSVVPYGRHHFNHAICIEEGHFRVRRLEATPEEVEAFKQEHGMFMPEQLEQISKPRTLVHEVESLDALEKWLESSWPS